MGQFSMEKPVPPGSALSGNQQRCAKARSKKVSPPAASIWHPVRRAHDGRPAPFEGVGCAAP